MLPPVAGTFRSRFSRLARRGGLEVEFSACDVSPQAVAFADGQARRAGFELHTFRLDGLREDIPPDYDLITSSLFLHHLNESDAVSLLGRMAAAARIGVLINDLRRGLAGYALAWVGTRVLSGSHVVRTDGPLSVRAAYNVQEVRRLAEAAGLTEARIQHQWPCRFLLTWMRSPML